MFCQHCGKEVVDQAVVCPHCGCAVGAQSATPEVNDSGSIGWLILGLFFPLVGLILFLVWKDTKPRCSKRAGIGALIGVIAGVVLGILASVISALLIGSAMNSFGDLNFDFDFEGARFLPFLFR